MSFCFISSLLPRNSKLNSTEQAICYEVQCDNYNKKIIVHIGDLTVECPTSGGIISNPSGFKGSINCPDYFEICDFKDNIMCNEMFDCLNKKVETDYDSYSFDINDEDFRIINKNYYNSKSSFIKINIIIVLFLLLGYIL